MPDTSNTRASVLYHINAIPSRVSSSFLTRMRIGSRMKLFVTSSTSEGIVAESRSTCKEHTYEIAKAASQWRQAKKQMAVSIDATNLHVVGKETENVVDLVLEATRKHLVGFVQNEHPNAIRSCRNMSI